MFICVQCNRCQSRFKTEASHAGKSAHCPQCQQPLTIPELGHQPELNSSEFVSNNTQDLLSKDQVHLAEQLSSLGNSSFGSNGKPDKNSIAKHLLDGFTGPISKNRPTVSYLVSTIVVAFVMLLLPLIYLSLMGLVSYGVVHYAWNNVNMIRDTSTLIGFLIMGIGYGTPIFAGTFLVLVMFKPLLARQPSQVRIRSLRRDKEPLLFGFIDKICESVDAPRPTRIDIDCQLNASASYGRGLACLFSKDLVLTIGLPMVAGLNTRQLAGVLAHEFGHFAQGAGMRMTHVIRVISHWLLRVVYERDAIDDWLERATQAFEVYLAWLPYLASVFIWVTRKILWVLMMIGQLFGSYLLRQMEYDADRYEARLAGSDTFMHTAVALQILGIATQHVHSEMEQDIRDGHLVDDLPEKILLTTEQFPEEVQDSVIHSIQESTTQWFDTHPADSDRITNALREETEGVFQVELPSSILFSDFESQAKATTWEFYREQFDNKVDRSQLVPIDKIIERQDYREASEMALDRFFQGVLAVTLPFPIRFAHSQPSENAQQTLQELVDARKAMSKEMPAAVQTFQTLQQLQAQLSLAVKLRYCCRAGLDINVSDLFDSNDGEKEADRLEDITQKAILQTTAALETYQNAATTRLGSALQLLHTPHVSNKIPNSEQAALRCDQLVQCFIALRNQIETVIPLTHMHGVLGLLIERLPEDDNTDSYFAAIRGITRYLTPTVQLLRNAWSRIPYPYNSHHDELTLGKYLIPDPPVGDQASVIFGCCDQAVNSTFPLYLRVLGDLTLIAEAVEKSLGLEPLPEMPLMEPDAAEMTTGT